MSPQTYRKHFIPHESNPEVFTSLIHSLGVTPSLQFQDVLSLDDTDLLSFLPRPAHALILVFPTTDAYEMRVKEEDNSLEPYEAEGDVRFFKQTINNACGLYAVLHAVCNGSASAELGMHVVFQIGRTVHADVLQHRIRLSIRYDDRQRLLALMSARWRSKRIWGLSKLMPT
jgi:hypothetical protein